MKLKVRTTESWFSKLELPGLKVNNWWKFTAILLISVNLILLAFLGLVAFSVKRTFLLKVTTKLKEDAGSITNYPYAIWQGVKGQSASSDIVIMDVKHINMQHLEFDRRQISGKKEFNYVPAKIRLGGGKPIKVKIRLKGDRAIHFDDPEKSSYRVQVKGNRTFFGMKRFSLQKPRVRNFIHEWIFLGLMKREGMIAPRYKFVKLVLNGKDNGLYAIEEHYDKHLIESHQRREGPIIRLKEDGDMHFKKAVIEPYKYKKWSGPDLIGQTRKAVQLFESFRRGELSASQVFEIDKLARLHAIADLTGAHHGLVPKSLRFYYNPVISKLEPIPFDGHVGTTNNGVFLASEFGLSRNKGVSWVSDSDGDWFAHLFNDKSSFDSQFVAAYIAELFRVSSKEFLDRYFDEAGDELSENLARIYSEFPLEDKIFDFGPGPFVFDENYYYRRAAVIRGIFQELSLEVHLGHADDQSIKLEIQSSDDRLPVKVIGLRCNDDFIAPPSGKAVLIEQGLTGEPEIHTAEFKIPAVKRKTLENLSCLKLEYQVLGLPQSRTVKVLPWPFHRPAYIEGDLFRRPGNMESFKFVRLDTEARVFRVGPGSFNVDRDMIIPPGFQFEVLKGTRLWLNNGALILSHSPLHFKGTEKEPISVSSRDNTGKGILVSQAGSESKLSHVTFQGMSHPASDGWSVSGMVNFYESAVFLEHVTFKENESEDALNIIRSSFLARDISFIDTKSDAIDVDFGTGEIITARFTNAGNDAIDVSGTEVYLDDISVDVAGDKAISAGEASQITGKRIRIQGAEIGVASKDNSRVSLEDIKVSRTRIGFSAFQKKPEFGPGNIKLKSLKWEQPGRLKIIEKNSRIVIEGVSHSGNSEKVAKTLYKE